jgi:hypothetical protein
VWGNVGENAYICTLIIKRRLKAFENQWRRCGEKHKEPHEENL